jgi:SAM-dependent methyltransferase
VEDATDLSRRAWNAVASGWANTRSEINTREQPVTDRMLDALGVRSGDLILEMCAGPGEVGLQLAEKYPDARVLISDFAPAMVDVAKDEGEHRGVANFETRVIDAQNIDLPDASVDGIVCRFGLMLVPDIPRAFTEARRVLRPGRTLVYTTWAPLDANPWMAVFGGAMIQRGHFAPPEGRPFMPLSTPDENIAAARAAGFDVIDAETVDVPQRYDDFDQFWDIQRQVAGPLAAILNSLPSDQVEGVKAQAQQLAEPYRVGATWSFPSRRVLVQAR